MYRSDLLAGKRILVTGGGTGLGASMAARFAELGAALVITGRRLEVLQATAARLREQAAARGAPLPDIEAMSCDLREPAAVDAMLDACWATRPLDVVVNNAAASFIAQTERLSPRAIDAVLGPTLHGAIHVTVGAGRRWIDAGHRGVVLSILSTSTITGRPFTVSSAIAKSGVLAMTKSLAVEWGPKGIRLVAIAPGLFPTPGALDRLMPGQRAGNVAARVPVGRVGRHEELANLACYLVSDEAAYVNGEMVTIDGGAHLRTSGAEDLLGWSEADWQALRSGR